MKKNWSVRTAEEFSRTRLSQSFFMRDFLYSEIAAIEGMANLPDDPALAIAAGRGLCEYLLEPLQATFGRLAIRSSYRSPEVNGFGCLHRLSCASNQRNLARHTWDRRSSVYAGSQIHSPPANGRTNVSPGGRRSLAAVRADIRTGRVPPRWPARDRRAGWPCLRWRRSRCIKNRA